MTRDIFWPVAVTFYNLLDNNVSVLVSRTKPGSFLCDVDVTEIKGRFDSSVWMILLSFKLAKIVTATAWFLFNLWLFGFESKFAVTHLSPDANNVLLNIRARFA